MNPRKYLENLFISKVRIKALEYFFRHAEESIHLRAAVRELNEEINAVRRELERMEKIGLLLTERRGNKKYFRLNKNFLFFDELMSMISKSTGLGADIINGLKKLGGLRYAVLTQGFTRAVPKGTHKLDLVVIGEAVNLTELKNIVDKSQKQLGRDIHYTVLTSEDFESRKRRKELFLMEVLLQEWIMLVGDKIEFYRGIDA